MWFRSARAIWRSSPPSSPGPTSFNGICATNPRMKRQASARSRPTTSQIPPTDPTIVPGAYTVVLRYGGQTLRRR